MAYTILQEHCSCCHQCKIACPVHAIRFHSKKYWIDPTLCINCGKCSKLCHNSAISSPDQPVPTPPHHEARSLNCDVLIIGAGGSGLTAAARIGYRTGGKSRIIVVEKAKKIGGNTWYAQFYRMIYSRKHREAGVLDTRYQEIGKLLRDTHWEEDPQLLYRIYEASEKHTDWMIDECGCMENFEFGDTIWGEPGLNFINTAPNDFPRPDTSIGPGGMGSFVVLKMEEMCKKYGITILTEHEAVRLTQDDSGSITGAIIRDPGGETCITSHFTLLAAGCFSRNEKLLRRVRPEMFHGEPVHLFSVPTCTGDGISMAEAVGADIDYINMRALTLGPAHHPYNFSAVCLCREPEVVIVDKKGHRWASEEDEMSRTHIGNNIPDCIGYGIADSNIAEIIIQRLLDQERDGPAGVNIFRRYRQEFEEEAATGEGTWIADSLEELAEKVGLPVDSFTKEIQKYNEFCRTGIDTDFFKNPETMIPVKKGPFYAFYLKRFQENAMGGCKTDSHLRVLDKAGQVIENLYAAGDDTRGVQICGDIGMEVVENAVSALTWCVLSGFIAGEEMSDRLTQRK